MHSFGRIGVFFFFLYLIFDFLKKIHYLLYKKGVNNKNIYDFGNIFAYYIISILQEGN